MVASLLGAVIVSVGGGAVGGRRERVVLAGAMVMR
jgi:hypothetical protein